MKNKIASLALVVMFFALACRAYRYPYAYVPQEDPPEEVAIEPLDITTFRVPNAQPRGPRSQVPVAGVLPFQSSSALCVVSDTDGEHR